MNTQNKRTCNKMIKNFKNYFESHNSFINDLGPHGYLIVTLDNCDEAPFISYTSPILSSVDEVRECLVHDYTVFRVYEYIEQFDSEIAEAITESFFETKDMNVLPEGLQKEIRNELNELLSII